MRVGVVYEPPNTGPYVRWCGESGAWRPLLPDRTQKDSLLTKSPFNLLFVYGINSFSSQNILPEKFGELIPQWLDRYDEIGTNTLFSLND